MKKWILFITLIAITFPSAYAQSAEDQSMLAKLEKAVTQFFQSTPSTHKGKDYDKAYYAWLNFLEQRRILPHAIKIKKQSEISKRMTAQRVLPQNIRHLRQQERELLEIHRGMRLPNPERTNEQIRADKRQLKTLLQNITLGIQTRLKELEEAADANALLRGLAVNPDTEILFSRTPYSLNLPGAPRASAVPLEIAKRVFNASKKGEFRQHSTAFPNLIQPAANKFILTFKPLRPARKDAEDLVFIFDSEAGMIYIHLIPLKY